MLIIIADLEQNCKNMLNYISNGNYEAADNIEYFRYGIYSELQWKTFHGSMCQKLTTEHNAELDKLRISGFTKSITTYYCTDFGMN